MIRARLPSKSKFPRLFADPPDRDFDAWSFMRCTATGIKLTIEFEYRYHFLVYDVSKVETEAGVRSHNLCYDPCANPSSFSSSLRFTDVRSIDRTRSDRFFNDNPTLELTEIPQEPPCLLRGQHLIVVLVVCQTSSSVSRKTDFMIQCQIHDILLN